MPKIAIIHDFLREYGGAERVLEALHEMYPDAPVYVAFVDKKALGKHWERFKNWDIHETWFAEIPFHKKIYSPLRFLAPNAFGDLDLSQFDIVISSSNAFMAKAVRVKNGKHFCYCHTPPRALYGYSTASAWKKSPVTRFFGNIINHYLRVVDFKIAQNVDVFIANSHETASRIEKFYRRESVVIYPPVNVDFAEIKNAKKSDYYFYIGRLVLQKHPELAVLACNKLDLPIKIAGTGQMMKNLEEIAGSETEFHGAVDDEELQKLFAGAKALIFPVEDEDFGIVPVEAMAHGVPIIAHNSGGPKETVIDGETGVLFDDLSEDGLVAAIKRFKKLDKSGKFDRIKIKKHAQQFSKKIFKEKISALLLSH